MHDRYRNDVPVMGWVEGALAEAADLRGVSATMMDLYDYPEYLDDLLEMCVEVEISFARAEIEAGADIIGLGEHPKRSTQPHAVVRHWATPAVSAPPAARSRRKHRTPIWRHRSGHCGSSKRRGTFQNRRHVLSHTTQA